MHEVNILRVTAELRQLVQDCATHCGVAISDVLRCSAAPLRVFDLGDLSYKRRLPIV
jgi:hypothetical protein